MNFIKAYTNFFKKYFPSPFSIAILLTIITFILALAFTENVDPTQMYLPQLGEFWFQGMFKSSLLAFTVHMMLILVLGHILALSSVAQKIINIALKYCTNTSNSVFIITFLTILVAMFNWGLGLIFGAIFTRKIGEHFQAQNKRLNYALVGASSYVGLMVWHGGLSGSATLTVAGANHSLIEKMGSIPISETILSPMNIVVTVALLITIPVVMAFIGKKSQNDTVPILSNPQKFELEDKSQYSKAEKFELNNFIGLIIGILILILVAYMKISGSFTSLNLQTTNLILLGLAFVFHGNIKGFLNALDEAIGDVSGILIQFPLYFGIMGLMQESGLASLIAKSMTDTSNEFTLPIFTFISAGIVNLFVPSGGGQWQIQGPIIVETANATGTSLPKMIMALAYGDQLTNMLQPFWALPLLGITGLKAKDILPYTLILFLLGLSIFLIALIIF